MKEILDLFRKQSEYKALLEARGLLTLQRPRPVMASGLSEGAKYAFMAAFVNDTGEGPVLVITPDEKDCLRLSSAFAEFGIDAKIYPGRDFVFRNVVSSHEYEMQRLGILKTVADKTARCIIATPDAALQFTMPQRVLREAERCYRLGDSLDIDEFSNYLVRCGYTRRELVEARGQFSVRGGVIDVFAPDMQQPYRFELFGDEIDSLCKFDVISQRRTEEIKEFTVFPVREVIFDSTSLSLVKSAVKNKLRQASGDVKDALKGELDALDLQSIPDFADKYISLVYPEGQCLLDYFRSGGKYCPIICTDRNGVKEKLRATGEIDGQNALSMVERGEISAKYAVYSENEAAFEAAVANSAAVVLDTFGRAAKGYGGVYNFDTQNHLAYQDSLDLLYDDVGGFCKSRYSVLILTENETVAKSYSDILTSRGRETLAVNPERLSGEIVPGRAVISWGCAVSGFVSPKSRFAVISLYKNRSLYSRSEIKRKSVKKKKDAARERIMSYAELTTGDYVVHDTHGVGIYEGLHALVGYDGCTRDFLKIKYADSGVLYVPCDSLDVLGKYIGQRSSDGSVRLNKLGGPEWTRTKTRVKGEVREMARELMQLYAERLRKEGIKYPQDDDFQMQFESTFEYEETEGQLAAARDIKKDMQSSHPMDRLLCGDVGFGKTEVAMRAAFKAALAGYQVAVLVPTTILAMQHYQTLTARMRGFPLEIDMLSRFRTPKQQAETLRKVARGETDIIVGTHRLLSSDVNFKRLGLIIVDEEQRFGVAHKEKLKTVSKTADVLTLTATPIPRTLNMAISGIRDMSILDEAPGDRLPPQTYVLEYDESVVKEALRRELKRGGQAFYLYNNVEDIESVAARVRDMCPGATVVTAHGKMDKDELSDIWEDVVSGATDILVCTTIIETGIDVPNANTMIIENADRMGLAQLHQLRGRIGRSSRRSYAFLTYRKNLQLTEIAEKRLEAIRQYTEFGAGFKIALRDLEIRGAGNLLGAKQHGHIENVGYDMYIKLLNEVILEEKGEAPPPVKECTLSLSFSAYIPDTYIRSESLRIEMYKKISHIQSTVDLDDVASELLDRFGEMPPITDNLLYIACLRAIGVKLGVRLMEQKEGRIIIHPYEFDAEKWVKIVSDTKGAFCIVPGRVPTVIYKIKSKDSALHKMCEVLEKGVTQ